MTVLELKQKIENLPDNMEVFLQKDAEGNGYCKVAGADSNCIAIEYEEAYEDIDILSSTWSAEDAGMEEEEWAGYLKLPRALVIFPY